MDIRHVTSIHGNIHYNGVHHLSNYTLGSTDVCLTDTYSNIISIYDIYRLFELPIPESPTTPKEYRKHLFSMYTYLYSKLQPDPIIGINSNLIKFVKLEPEIENKIDNQMNQNNKNLNILIYRFTFDYLQRNINIEGKKISSVIDDIISRTKPFIVKGYDNLKDNFKESLLFFESNKFIRLNKAKTHFAIVIPPNIKTKDINENLIIDIWSKYKTHLINMLTFEDAVFFLKRKEELLKLSTCQQLIIYYFKCNLL